MSAKVETVIFTHIPKTGGVTIHMILHRQYVLKCGNIFTSDNVGKMDMLVSLSERFRRNLILVKGHLHFGIHKYIPRPVNYFSFFRDPVRRVISMYNYLYTSPRAQYYKEINEKQYTLDDLFESGRILNIDNCQVRFLCGVDDIPFGGVNEEHLQMALNNLNEHYRGGVGITEHFDESILLFAKRFKWRTPLYVKQNVNRVKKIKLDEISPETMEKLRYYNRYDEVLYKRALEIFQEQIEDAGPGFKNEVEAFKEEILRRHSWTRLITAIFFRLYRLRFYTGTQKG